MTFQASAAIYDRHVGRYARQLSAALIEAAGIDRRDRVLDVGCGPGGLTRALAELVGREERGRGRPVRAVCRRMPRTGSGCRRPARRGRNASLPRRPVAVLSQLVVNFLSEPQAGLREMSRVARPNGVVVGCVWDYAEGMTMLPAFWDAAPEIDPSAPDEGRTMRFWQTRRAGCPLGIDVRRGRRRRAPRGDDLRGLRRLLVPVPARHRAVGGVLRLARPGAPGRTPRSVLPPPRLADRGLHPQRPRLVRAREYLAKRDDALSLGPGADERDLDAECLLDEVGIRAGRIR